MKAGQRHAAPGTPRTPKTSGMAGDRQAGGEGGGLDPRVARMKERLLTAPYEICMARALHFTRSYRETEGMDPHLRNALALKRTLENQKISIAPDEHIAGSKTEKFLAGPLSVERGDFLRALQLELDILPMKLRPFRISGTDRSLFLEEILPYWSGRSVRDAKARGWEERDLIDIGEGPVRSARRWLGGIRFVRHIGLDGARRLLGANLRAPLTLSRLRTLHALRYELARNNPTPAVFCFDVQGHLSLGVDKVVTEGMGAVIERARARRERLAREDPENTRGLCFLEAVIISLEAAIRYAGRFADLADEMSLRTSDPEEKRRLSLISTHCRRVPRLKPRTMREAMQAAWIAQCVGEIQYGTHEVFAVGRADQYLYPYYRADIDSGRLTRGEAKALIQEFYLKLTANVEPIPEVGMETNSVLGNSQHCVVIGGVDPDGADATNDLSMLMLEAHEEMGGAINQLSVRFHEGSPRPFVRRTAEVFRRTNGIAVYNDEVIVKALEADGLGTRDARDYCIVGCIETSGQSDTHGCPGGHEIVLPAVLMLALTRGRVPPAAPGQAGGYDSGDPAAARTFEQLLAIFRGQLAHQVSVLVEATACKDEAYRERLPAPYVSALMDDCIEKAADVTAGGARYDFTSLDLRGLATLVDSLMAIRMLVYDRGEIGLRDLIGACLKNFEGSEVLRQRLIHEPPKYGTGDAAADDAALEVIGWIHGEASRRRNIRGGRYRVCFYSYGNHVVDGIMVGATPDGRRRGEPISNGVSPSNTFIPSSGAAGPMRTVAKFPPEKVSSGVSLNMRFHPNFLRTEQGVDTFASLICTYFRKGGMHIQPNVVSSETLREAQRRPEQYRDLVVKVSGYSAYFTDLGRSIQEDIIARCEFGR